MPPVMPVHAAAATPAATGCPADSFPWYIMKRGRRLFCYNAGTYTQTPKTDGIMGKSLADQLLGAGLVDGKKARKLQKEKRQQGKGRAADSGPDRARLQEQQAAQAEKDRELNRQRKAEAEAHERQAQVRQLLETHRIRSGGDIRFQFADPRDRRIRQLYVSHDVRERLAKGLLAICATKDGYCIVPSETADRVAGRDPTAVMFRVDPAEERPDEDDPYRDFPIPDDIDW